MLKFNSRLRAKISKHLTRLGLESFYQSNLKDVNGVILDIGSGTQALNYGNSSRIVRLDIKKTENVDIAADAHDLPLPDSSFDAIICKQVLEHLYHPHKAVDEMRRVLKPGGKLVASTCFYWPIHGEPYDYFRYTRFGLEKLFEKWSNVTVRAQNGLLGVLGIHFVRLAIGRSIFRKLFYPVFISIGACLILLDKFLLPILGSEVVTSGYWVTAVK